MNAVIHKCSDLSGYGTNSVSMELEAVLAETDSGSTGNTNTKNFFWLEECQTSQQVERDAQDLEDSLLDISTC